MLGTDRLYDLLVIIVNHNTAGMLVRCLHSIFFPSGLKAHLLSMPDSKWSLHDWWIAVVAFFLENPTIVNKVMTRQRIHENQTCTLAVMVKTKGKGRSFKDVLFRVKRETRRTCYPDLLIPTIFQNQVL